MPTTKWALVFASIACAASAATQAQFEKIIPFVTDGEVRIEGLLRLEPAPASVELAAQITDAQSHSELWHGTLGRANAAAGRPVQFSRHIRWLKPRLWTPENPNLYDLKISAQAEGQPLAETSVRIGFRSFTTRNGNFLLNSRPIFLQGIAINPPGRTIPPQTGESRAFAEAYVHFLKSQNVNIIRLTHDSQVWFDVCDELGMLIYQGQYGSPPGSERKETAALDLDQSISAYKNLFEAYARHPSIVIHILSNELPVSGARGKAFHNFLTSASTALKAWDPTRLIIGNAGYGEGREGDICDVHRYWGWYYNTFLTFYNLRDQNLFGDPGKNQPITFSECVGNFTGPNGEYNLVVRKQLGAQLNWTGHSPDQREDAAAYQSFMLKEAIETFRRLRSANPRLAGLMPFTILFNNWSGISSFDQMDPKPAMTQLALSYQPVLLSWELWTPQVFSGADLKPIAHVINDARDGTPLIDATLHYEIVRANGETFCRSELPLPTIPYYGAWSTQLVVHVPGGLPTDDYHVCGTLWKSGRLVSTNSEPLFVAGEDWPAGGPLGLEQRIQLFDPSSKTAAALQRLHLPFAKARSLAPADLRAKVLVVGEEALAKGPSSSGLRQFIEKGGRLLCLRQNPDAFDARWLPEPVAFFAASANLPAYPPRERPFSGNMNVNPERPDHPIFAGLERKRFQLWSDYTEWNQSKPGFPAVYPVTMGFKLKIPESLARTAILADYDRGLEGVALCEMFCGRGSAILCGFDLVSRVGRDPVADRLLLNLIRYAASHRGHEPYPYIDSTIVWGDYASERGLITGSQNGLLLHTRWVCPPTNPTAEPLTQEEGAWNTRPGDQFVPDGRSPFGPYGYSTGSSLREGDPGSKLGEGFFRARVPAGKTVMLTSVKNPSSIPCPLTISVNGSASSQSFTIPANSSTNLSSALSPGVTNLYVQFNGSKSLVLLKTTFQ